MMVLYLKMHFMGCAKCHAFIKKVHNNLLCSFTISKDVDLLLFYNFSFSRDVDLILVLVLGN